MVGHRSTIGQARGRAVLALAALALGLVVVAETASAQMSRAETIAGNTGRVIGQAMACGASKERVAPIQAAAWAAWDQAATGPDDQARALELYLNTLSVGATRQKNGQGEPCPDVLNVLDDVARKLQVE